MCYIINIIGGGYGEYTQCVTLLPSLVEGTGDTHNVLHYYHHWWKVHGIHIKCVKPLPSLIGGYRGYTQCVTSLPSLVEGTGDTHNVLHHYHHR